MFAEKSNKLKLVLLKLWLFNSMKIFLFVFPRRFNFFGFLLNRLFEELLRLIKRNWKLLNQIKLKRWKQLLKHFSQSSHDPLCMINFLLFLYLNMIDIRFQRYGCWLWFPFYRFASFHFWRLKKQFFDEIFEFFHINFTKKNLKCEQKILQSSWLELAWLASLNEFMFFWTFKLFLFLF